ncbi:MAG: carbamoyltransferase HypF [Chloroflexaceae bacterium]|nr:carbamoyltransferase HypF [Chloroflexaceae bacterium]
MQALLPPPYHPSDTPARLWVAICGAVQGVGFRPFVYRLATELHLTGWVLNDVQGVRIEVEGPTEHVAHFLARLQAELPPRAIIHSLETAWLDPAGYSDFVIRHSDAQGTKTTLILPDSATCADCLAEVTTSTDRRHGYAFTNCTNCGPRFSIVQALPYDRPNTTMQQFVMCPTCQAEYDDPRNRRFHAQPNACPVCGPALSIYARDTQGEWATSITTDADALQRAVAALQAGQIVAVKGLGGFHLMVDATTSAAVAQLRERKPRRDKPFALMVRDTAQAASLCIVSEQAAALLTSAEAPIVLLPRLPDAPVAANVAPDVSTFGVMLPATPLHHLLLRLLDRPVVATSGNLQDEPICTDEHEATHRLGAIADLFLVHNRPIARHIDDSVLWLVRGEGRLLRRARGYAPLPVLLPAPVPPVLAVGAHLKNAVALSVGRQVFISQHIGDLETPQAIAAFERVIADFLRLYETTPQAIAHDLHPDYYSSQWARQQPVPTIAVQHHHAHLAACLAEHGATGHALGIIWDGTGYGSDGTIWGGEFLHGDALAVARVAHLHPFRLPGGDAAVREPRRVALALLWACYGAEALAWEHLRPVQALRPAERGLLGKMLARGLNAPITTSMGRLFDGIAALIGLHQQVSYEGQAAIALETIADRTVHDAYPLPVQQQAAALCLDWRPLVQAVCDDLRQGQAVGTIAARFHNALIDAALYVVQAIGAQQVALSGGCFQNQLLTERLAQRLSEAGCTVLLHRQVPPNDGGISLGQVAVAAARLQAGV